MAKGAGEKRSVLRMRFETVGSISAIVIGVAALFVAADQARIARSQTEVMREEIHASVWPIVQIETYSYVFDGHAEVGIRLRNVGVGPALLDGVAMHRDGQALAGLNDLIRLSPAELVALGPEQTRADTKARILARGDQIDMVRAVWQFAEPPAPETRTLFDRQFQTIGELVISTCYCSVLDRCWMYQNAEQSRPTAIKDCEAFEPGNF